MPIACNVGNNAFTTPLTGDTKTPSLGFIAMPFPKIPEANASSFTLFNGKTSPFNGLAISTTLLFSFKSTLFIALFSSCSTFSVPVSILEL